MYTQKAKTKPKKQVLQVVGRIAFCTKFVRLGRALLNSSYAVISSAYHLHYRQDIIPVSHEMFADIT